MKRHLAFALTTLRCGEQVPLVKFWKNFVRHENLKGANFCRMKIKMILRMFLAGFIFLAIWLTAWWLVHKYSAKPYFVSDPDWTFSTANGGQYGLIHFSDSNYFGCDTVICFGSMSFELPLPLYLFACLVICGVLLAIDGILSFRNFSRQKKSEGANQNCSQ
ncbi:MAG TPA: hypothetical protein VMD27_13915 [Candidatus Aquilonibacter sp.]|nr:hypothetical protein [Candidatus Aquilonibacter sp.]